ncbi:hypothetical protein GCM10011357_20030 [Lacimicrobium alkaliphilum]|uniref:Uncharacterized protein n=2 Tax=Lacimicrobium alkaliphilum TaxID=1526571 RepID=A0ABQ1RF62_9ALTE|nr:hypothetical protein GCM10011357_20030 [Lacimicrobium alkaliphilum]
MDMWGNRSGYSYQGKMWHDATGQYFISLIASNDPGFTPQAQAPLELMMEQSALLHMKYHYRGVEILLHLIR